jgi:hypothetical protein
MLHLDPIKCPSLFDVNHSVVAPPRFFRREGQPPDMFIQHFPATSPGSFIVSVKMIK